MIPKVVKLCYVVWTILTLLSLGLWFHSETHEYFQYNGGDDTKVLYPLRQWAVRVFLVNCLCFLFVPTVAEFIVKEGEG